MPNTETFDSREYEYADTSVSMFGLTFSGLRGLKYKTKLGKEVVKGANNRGLTIQMGEADYEGTLMLLKSDYDILNEAAIAAGYRGILFVPHTKLSATCVYQKENDPKIKTVRILKMGFLEAEDGFNQGDKFSEVSLPFIALDIKTA